MNQVTNCTGILASIAMSRYWHPLGPMEQLEGHWSESVRGAAMEWAPEFDVVSDPLTAAS